MRDTSAQRYLSFFFQLSLTIFTLSLTVTFTYSLASDIVLLHIMIRLSTLSLINVSMFCRLRLYRPTTVKRTLH